MKRFVCILRGINVGGKRKILMKDLRGILEDNNFKNVKTYIQSGNIGFDSSEKHSELAIKVEKIILAHFGFEVPVIVLKQDTVYEIIKAMPYSEEENLHVTFLKEVPSQEKVEVIRAIDFKPEEYLITDKAVYLKCADKYHKSRLSNNFFEKKLEVTATTRNWKTVNKLVEL